MKLAKNVRPQPDFWRYLPFLSRHFGTTIVSTIYLKPAVYNDLLSENPGLENIGHLIHEQAHVKHAKQLGYLQFALRYLLSGKFRFFEELEASKEQWKYLKSHGITPDLDRKARILSSWIYFWPVSYEFAKKEIEKTWAKL